ncbi:hypothetical protein CERSUDRAFT_115076 [Gelatoporia subvermispora B]|uniref:Uncharacterized protein n=1 Tax=Ceriporiopsis subvermispora (strain B) TaxID=914234 RepID=M2PLE6_CERS8|nr:hypothetical protein CERSUDRAFT_115076 [Gelatoporia subvermispora B]
MSSKKGEPIPYAAQPAREEPTSDIHELNERLNRDPRFNPPTPSVWKRVALLVLIVVLFYVGIKMRVNIAKQSQVVYADRYSEEFKYRPAASPVITERLNDGRTLLRGAQPAVAM